MTSSALDRLLEHLRGGGSRTVVREDGRSWSAAELWARARTRAHRYAVLGLRPGDRVVAMAEPSVDLVEAMLGAYLAGMTWVPINPRYRHQEVAHILGDCRPSSVLGDEACVGLFSGWMGGRVELLGPVDAEPVGDLPGLADSERALMIYTSGTTGPSKGVQLSLGALVEGIGALVRLWRWTDADTLSLMLPLFHVHGLGIGIHGGLLQGVQILLHRKFSPEQVVRDVADGGATIFMGVPTMYTRLLRLLDEAPRAGEALARARLFTAGSAALPARDLDRFERATGHRIVERYGMTETLLTLSNPCTGERRAGSVGRPVPGVQIRIVDDEGRDIGGLEPGELWVKTPGMMIGYWERPDADAEAFAPGGWFRTGDVVTRADDGYVSIVGRKSVDIIKSGGFKIGAREIEDVLSTHPQVLEVAVYGEPDDEWGEVVAAAVVPVEGTAPIDADAFLSSLQSWVARDLADYKKPRRVRLLDALPRNALGKVRKAQLRLGSSC